MNEEAWMNSVMCSAVIPPLSRTFPSYGYRELFTRRDDKRSKSLSEPFREAFTGNASVYLRRRRRRSANALLATPRPAMQAMLPGSGTADDVFPKARLSIRANWPFLGVMVRLVMLPKSENPANVVKLG